MTFSVTTEVLDVPGHWSRAARRCRRGGITRDFMSFARTPGPVVVRGYPLYCTLDAPVSVEAVAALGRSRAGALVRELAVGKIPATPALITALAELTPNLRSLSFNGTIAPPSVVPLITTTTLRDLTFVDIDPAIVGPLPRFLRRVVLVGRRVSPEAVRHAVLAHPQNLVLCTNVVDPELVTIVLASRWIEWLRIDAQIDLEALSDRLRSLRASQRREITLDLARFELSELRRWRAKLARLGVKLDE